MVGRGLGGGLLGARSFLAVGFGIALVALEQRIALQLALDEGLELKVRQLQQLDRLLQLRGDDQPLPLTKLLPRPQRQIRLLA